MTTGHPNDGVQVERLVPADGGAPAGATVSAEVGSEHTAVVGEGGHHPCGGRFVRSMGESVTDHKRPISIPVRCPQMQP